MGLILLLFFSELTLLKEDITLNPKIVQFYSRSRRKVVIGKPQASSILVHVITEHGKITVLHSLKHY